MRQVEGRTVKVFEFAKEIGMETLQLMDKIREWKLPVRSHMADLPPELMEAIKAKLGESDSEDAGKPAAKSSTKKVTKKASAARSTKASKPPAAPRAANAKSTRASGAQGDDAASDSVKKAVVVKRASAKVVVRKKADEEARALAEAEAAQSEVDQRSDLTTDENDTKLRSAASVDETAAGAIKEQQSTEGLSQQAVVQASNPSVESAEMTSSTAQPLKELAPPAALRSESESEPASAQAATPSAQTIAPASEQAQVPSRKREVVMTASGPQSGIRSEPKRNIVGRMDLSRVQPPPGTRGAIGPRPAGSGPIGARGPGGFGGGPRPGVGGGLRAGFVVAPPMPGGPGFDGHDDLDKKKFEVKREKKVGTGAAGGREEPIQTFSATEFRKREMVFQPKKKKGMLNRVGLSTQITTPKASKRIVRVDQTMKVSDLAQELGVKAAQLTKVLMAQGVMATMSTDLDFDTIALIVPEFGFEAQNVHKTVDDLIESTAFGDLEAEKVARPPVVTIMGHVDHGKTSLLDAIRKSKVAQGEAGGITQHIGAYQVKSDDGRLVTFIDTPGHEAFTAMRARGANVTDIVIIVVAADDGVMPQTIEAVSHAKAAGVPIIVAVNKMDKAGANPDRIKQQMTEYELVPEEWGGTTIYAPVSAVTRKGLDELLEHINLVAEVADLKANPKRSATGVVIESRMDKGRGPVATLLVQDGTLSIGQPVVVGSVAGRVRSLMNERGERVESAGPSAPVEVLGLEAVPNAGDRFDAVESDEAATRISKVRKESADKEKLQKPLSMEALFDKLKEGAVKELPVVLKTDVAGSAEAIKGMFDKMATDEVKIKVIHSAVGGISESDVLLASTAKGIVVGFNVRPDGGAQSEAKRTGAEIKTYSIVYELMDDMKKALSGLLSPETRETDLGRAEVRNIFVIPKSGTVAGCAVVDGKILRSAQVRLVRDGKVIYTGKLGSLKRFKDDAKEVAQGYECGMSIENYNDIKVGDVIEAFSQESVTREL